MSRIKPYSADLVSKANSRCFILPSEFLNHIDLTPLGETKMPLLRNSLLALSWPCAGYSIA